MLTMVSFDVCRYLPLLTVNSTAENNASKIHCVQVLGVHFQVSLVRRAGLGQWYHGRLTGERSWFDAQSQELEMALGDHCVQGKKECR